ncbi:hypothetical protein D4R99_03445 [bacterium]|nr:MAG: hypothetical protein D4R99_03445 [bacterium]
MIKIRMKFLGLDTYLIARHVIPGKMYDLIIVDNIVTVAGVKDPCLLSVLAKDSAHDILVQYTYSSLEFFFRNWAIK